MTIIISPFSKPNHKQPMHTLTQAPNDQLSLSTKQQQLGSFVGKTPLYPIQNLHRNRDVRILAKLEWQQFGGSVKARPACRIIADAIGEGSLTKGMRLLDASSGNTGIAYAHIGAALGIPVTLCLPENASKERKQILKALDTDIHFSPPTGGTDEAQQQARQLAEQYPDKFYYADQYRNPSNWRAHYDTTAPEILRVAQNEVTHFIAGLGTTGTFTGTGRRLKEHNKDIRLIGLQPDIPMHGLEGWKHLATAHVPDIYDNSLPDEIREISTGRALEVLKAAARHEGLMLSPSSAANLAGALQLAGQIDRGTIVTIFPDDSSKYGDMLQKYIY